MKSLLDHDAVQYWDLGVNALPPVQTLQKFAAFLSMYRSFGERLSFGLDGSPLTGNDELDHWRKAARNSRRRLTTTHTVRVLSDCLSAMMASQLCGCSSMASQRLCSGLILKERAYG